MGFDPVTAAAFVGTQLFSQAVGGRFGGGQGGRAGRIDRPPPRSPRQQALLNTVTDRFKGAAALARGDRAPGSIRRGKPVAFQPLKPPNPFRTISASSRRAKTVNTPGRGLPIGQQRNKGLVSKPVKAVSAPASRTNNARARFRSAVNRGRRRTR